ncbi:MAG TPA: TonB C-terminal domain-containing protein [Terriglobales bacterium]|jgi:hypothetical protein
MSEMRTHRTERAGWGFALSLLLHGGLAAVVVTGAWQYLPLGGAHPGTAAAGSIQANLVSTIPGGAIPMPSPVIAPTKNRLANDLPGEAVSTPLPRRAAPPKSIPLPSINPEDLAREAARADIRRLAQADREKKPDNRVAYGAGGRVSFSATSSTQGAGGSGGMSFGDANFGNLYTDWVNHLRDRLQYYWNLQPRYPGLPAGQKVTVRLTVRRSGSVDSIAYVSRSSSVDVNAMAFNAVSQMAQAEHFPLPAGYQHDALTVSVAFELTP